MRVGASVRQAGKIAFYLLLLFLVVVAFSPLSFWMPDAGLDSSWVAMANEAFAKNWKWGRDVAFTYGPFGFLVLRQFHPATWVLQSIFWIATSLIFSGILWKSFRQLPIIFSAILTWLFLLCVIGTGDLFFYSLPLIVCVNYRFRAGIRKNYLSYFVAVLSGCGALIKFSYAPLPLAFYFLLDAYNLLKERKASYLTPTFLFTVLIGFVAAGQSLGDFPEWLRLSLAISSGYGVAMQTSGYWREVALFAMAAILYLSCSFFLSEGKVISLKNSLFLACNVLCFMILQKAAFVRHDSHGLSAWNVLLTCSVFYFAHLWKDHRRIIARLFLCALLTLNFSLYFVWHNKYFPSSLYSFCLKGPYEIMTGNLGIIREFFQAPKKYTDNQATEYVNTLGQIKEKNDLGFIEGTVDYISSHQMEVIANGLNYRPRPVFQSYSVYMPSLIDRHLQFFNSEKAPQNIIFGLDDIDSRYPGSSEGGSWPAFFTHYDPWDFVSNKLILKRREKPREVNFQNIGKQILTFKQSLDLSPYNRDPIWMVVRFKENLFGTLARVLFKGPIIKAKAVLDTNRIEEFRIIPTISEKGQMASPLIRTGLDFAGLYFPESEPTSRRVKSISFDTSKLGKGLYSTISVELYSLKMGDSFEYQARPSLSVLFEAGNMMARLAKISGIFEVRLENNRFIAYAHAASKLRLKLPIGVKKIQIGFGIQEGAWRGEGNTDGVCFKVESSSVPPKEIFRQCLQPKTNENDRKEINREVDVQDGVDSLILSTECLDNCYWDWAYWTNLAEIKN